MKYKLYIHIISTMNENHLTLTNLFTTNFAKLQPHDNSLTHFVNRDNSTCGLF